jgi:hypothetical protein
MTAVAAGVSKHCLRRSALRIFPMLVLPLISGGCDSPVEPTTKTCIVTIGFSLTRNDGAIGRVMASAIVDGKPGFYFDLAAGGLSSQSWELAAIGTSGHHVLEVVITEQPASPTSYTLKDQLIRYYGIEGGGLLSCGPVFRTVALPSQTATLATGERFTIPFDL